MKSFLENLNMGKGVDLLSEDPSYLGRKAIASQLMHLTVAELQFLQMWSVELHLEQILEVCCICWLGGSSLHCSGSSI